MTKKIRLKVTMRQDSQDETSASFVFLSFACVADSHKDRWELFSLIPSTISSSSDKHLCKLNSRALNPPTFRKTLTPPSLISQFCPGSDPNKPLKLAASCQAGNVMLALLHNHINHLKPWRQAKPICVQLFGEDFASETYPNPLHAGLKERIKLGISLYHIPIE